MPAILHRADVIVVGGGPAGLAAALAARRHGLSVAVVDHAQPPIDKACGEGLMPHGIAALRQLGVAVTPDQGALLRGIRFLAPGVSAEAEFPLPCGVGMRRLALHTLLMEHAAKAGVVLFWGRQAHALIPGGVTVDGRTLEGRWVIGADGQDSRCRRWAGLDVYRCRRRRIGLRRHFRLAPWTDMAEVHWGRHCQTYITPVGPQEVCVALITQDQRHRFEHLFEMFPAVSRRLAGAPATTPVRGAVTAGIALRAVTRGRVALVGDASGSIDAITGEGLSLAFLQAIALGEALARDDMAGYAAAHRRIIRLPGVMAGWMLAMDRHPWFCQFVLRAFAARPAWFSRLLKIHVGGTTPASLELGWSQAGPSR